MKYVEMLKVNNKGIVVEEVVANVVSLQVFGKDTEGKKGMFRSYNVLFNLNRQLKVLTHATAEDGSDVATEAVDNTISEFASTLRTLLAQGSEAGADVVEKMTSAVLEMLCQSLTEVEFLSIHGEEKEQFLAKRALAVARVLKGATVQIASVVVPAGTTIVLPDGSDTNPKDYDVRYNIMYGIQLNKAVAAAIDKQRDAAIEAAALELFA